MTKNRKEPENAHKKPKDEIEQAICRAFCEACPATLTDGTWGRLVVALVNELKPILNRGKHKHHKDLTT